MATGKRRKRTNLCGFGMTERTVLTPEDRQLLTFLKTLTDRQLLLLVAMVVMKDSRIRDTVLEVIQQ